MLADILLLFQETSSLIKIVRTLQANSDYKNLLENGAFESGSDVNTILFVGAIYIRDNVLSQLNFERADIDKHDPGNQLRQSDK